MVFRLWPGVIVSALAAFSCGTAAAGPFDSGGGGLDALRATWAYQRVILETVQATSAFKAVRCEAAHLILRGPTYVLHDPTFDKAGAAQTGDWGDSIVVQGCGTEHTLNVLAHVKTPGAITSEPLLPGSTRASLGLQMDAISYAFDAALVDRDGCKPIFILDTEFKAVLRPANATTLGQPWSERWTVVQCDKRKVVDMTFIPDQTGTTINAVASP